MKKYNVILYFCIAFATLNAQTTIQEVLTIIEGNNKLLKAKQYEIQAMQKGLKTNISLADPMIEYDFFKGTPQSAGIQHDVVVSQTFDLSVVLGKKKKYANAQAQQLDTLFLKHRREILLRTKQLCYDWIYNHKAEKLIRQRLESTQKIYNDFKKKLNTGDINIIELNKAKMQWLSVQNTQKNIKRKLLELQLQIQEKNDGKPINLNQLEYPKSIEIAPLAEVLAKSELRDYGLKILEIQGKVQKEKLALNKSLNLPTIELGYRFQAVLGQHFNGTHFAMNIPLWANKNKIQQAKIEQSQNEMELAHYHTMHKIEIKSKYHQFQQLKSVVETFRKELDDIPTQQLLQKAFNAGQISTIDYFNELNFLYESQSNLLQMENELFKLKASLNRFDL